MAKHPSSPEAYLKLAKSCKYFFEKLPLLIVERIHDGDDGGKKFCSNEKEIDCIKKNGKPCVSVDLFKITKINIWLTGELYLTGTYDPNFASILLPKLYECKDAFIRLHFYSTNMEEFKFWGKAFTKFTLGDNSKITATDGSPIMIDQMLTSITNVEEFQYWFSRGNRAATSVAIKSVLKLKNLDTLKAYKNTKIRVNFLFQYRMSNQYKLQLDSLIDDIIASEVPKHLIEYPGQDKEKLQKMKNRFFD